MSQTTTMPTSNLPAPDGTSPRPPDFWRSLARAFLGLWWIFVVALASAIASYLGNHAPSFLTPLIPQIVAWLQGQTLLVQIGLGLVALAVLALMGWLTYLAWRHRERQKTEQAEAEVRQQTAVITGVMEPRLDSIGATVDETGRDVKALLQDKQGASPLTLVRDLDRASFYMGDSRAATFRYVRQPVEAIFQQAVTTLTEASKGQGQKQGILVTGEANAGKTRLGLEALIAALPDWDALVWDVGDPESRIESATQHMNGNVAVFLDDIQNYATGGAIASGPDGRSAQASVAGPGATLQTLYKRITQDAAQHGAHVVFIATCRKEKKAGADGSLGWLFEKLEEVTVPTFDRDENSPQARAIIAEFAREGEVRDEWNGTLGSLVLGLGRLHDEYVELVNQRNPENPAVPVLRAMKLLTIGGVFALTGRRLRAVCDQILHETTLAEPSKAWDTALAELRRLEFAKITADEGGVTLAIRKTDYFTYVVSDYPADWQLPSDRNALLNTLADLSDDDGLFDLGNGFYFDDQFTSALSAYDEAIRLNPTDATAYYNKSVVLALSGHLDEALDACTKAIELTPGDPDCWKLKAAILNELGRAEEARAAEEQAPRLEGQP